jgi:predicted dehydrogenase
MSIGHISNRREFIKKASVAGLGLSMLPEFLLKAESIKPKVRIGFIGIGLRGTNHLENVLLRNDVEIPAICDIDPQRITLVQSILEKAGRQKAEAYTGNEFSYQKMLQREDIDGVVISTPWRWHARMTVDAMKAHKYAGVEVSAATTLEECWDIVNTYEETRVPCMILENVCYRRDIMAVLNMVREGVFGELIHCQCGYQHDLRGVKFNDGKEPYGRGAEFGEKAISEARWRTFHSVHQNADIYPTHGAGPIATMLNINRGNRFVSLTSTATKSRGLHNYIVAVGGEDHPNASVSFKLGDVVTTVIKTANEESIVVTHNTNLPRPYSLGFRVQGTKGLWMNDGNVIYIEGKSSPDEWEPDAAYLDKYDHMLWKKYLDQAEGAGHGGMDFFVIHAFIEIIKRQCEAPLDAYDAAAWSAITPLSEFSIANNGEPFNFPDFTRGQWMNRNPVFCLNDEY